MVSEPSFAIRILAEKKYVCTWISWRGIPESKDSHCDLQRVIPLRIYGDGAEAQRSLSHFGFWSWFAVSFKHVSMEKVQRCWINRPRKAKIWSDHFTVPTLLIVEHVWQQGLAAKLQTDFHHSWHRQLQFTAICPWLHAMHAQQEIPIRGLQLSIRTTARLMLGQSVCRPWHGAWTVYAPWCDSCVSIMFCLSHPHGMKQSFGSFYHGSAIFHLYFLRCWRIPRQRSLGPNLQRILLPSAGSPSWK